MALTSASRQRAAGLRVLCQQEGRDRDVTKRRVSGMGGRGQGDPRRKGREKWPGGGSLI